MIDQSNAPGPSTITIEALESGTRSLIWSLHESLSASNPNFDAASTATSRDDDSFMSDNESDPTVPMASVVDLLESLANVIDGDALSDPGEPVEQSDPEDEDEQEDYHGTP